MILNIEDEIPNIYAIFLFSYTRFKTMYPSPDDHVQQIEVYVRIFGLYVEGFCVYVRYHGGRFKKSGRMCIF